MKTIFTTILFFVLSFSFLAAQDQKGAIIFEDIDAQQNATLYLDISSYPPDAVGALKDKLLAYPEKVLHIKFVNKQSIMMLTYNGKMLKEDLIKAFEQTGINYRKPIQSSVSNNGTE